MGQSEARRRAHCSAQTRPERRRRDPSTPLCESTIISSELAAARIPVVAVATGRFRPDVCCVRIDDFRAASDMTTHLIGLGHTRIGFIKGHPNQTASAQRFAGFQATMEESGLTPNPAYIEQGYFTYRSDWKQRSCS